MDFLHGVNNFLWSSTAAVGNFGLKTTRAIGNQIFGGSTHSGVNNTNHVATGGGGWTSYFWSGQQNPSGIIGNTSCAGGPDPPFDVRRKDVVMMWSRVGSNFVRVGGLSGALAVSLGAYGAHMFHPDKEHQELKHVFDIGNNIHLVHSAALLAIPMTRRPVLAGSLLSVGTLIFCGSCYYHAITGDKSIRWITPYGGMLLIIGWITIAI